jgi:hypothetical protein
MFVMLLLLSEVAPTDSRRLTAAPGAAGSLRRLLYTPIALNTEKIVCMGKGGDFLEA